jgi:hypothetical protein
MTSTVQIRPHHRCTDADCPTFIMSHVRGARYASSRQKACQPCSNAKVRCDRKQGSCGRCALRGLACTYPQALSLGADARNTDIVGETEVSNPPSTPSTLLLNSPPLNSGHIPFATTQNSNSRKGSIQNTDRSSASERSSTATEARSLDGSERDVAPYLNRDYADALDSICLELVCPINVDDIGNRWLQPYVPAPGQTLKEYPPSIMAFVYRILKSYASIAVRGRGVLPFVHYSQMISNSPPLPISTCLSLVRICEKPLPGSEAVAADVLQREMNNLYERYRTYDDVNLLAVFQAYLIYSMVLFFRLDRDPELFLRQAIMNLQEIACSSSRGGLVCIAEQQRARPRWEAWIVAEAKRRTLYTMCLFDNLLSAQDGLPTYLGTELRGLPAPANRSLWQSRARRDWETEYNTHLADWVDGGLHIDELWPIPPNLTESDVVERRGRVDQWLEDVDEYGTMIYAVTSCTHGG